MALVFYFFVTLLGAHFCCGTSEGFGKWPCELSTERPSVTIPQSLFKDSKIYVFVSCESKDQTASVTIEWSLTQIECWQCFAELVDRDICVSNHTISSRPTTYKCGDHFILEDYTPQTTPSPPKQVSGPVETEPIKTDKESPNPKTPSTANSVFTIPQDGLYSFTFQIYSKSQFTAPITIEMKSDIGYISVIDWPLLPFYGVMCLIYVIYGIGWLVVSFCQWRDLLRIQFWIGGVILLGMLEKAVFYAEYQSINSTGTSVKGAAIAAEIVSCAKRTLARMLVIIVSLGFGIVKPRLGAMLHKIMVSGVLYFVLASWEGYKRKTGFPPKNYEHLLASVPLALLDSIFCWWIFSNLVQTMRTLRLRRNLVKLSLYKHFSNALYFSVIASCCFMVYAIRFHTLANCLTDWKDLWVDEAYWHILFSIILLVIMVLWRPTNNNQRYAFTPLLDNPEDEDDEEEQFTSEAFGLKMRGSNNSASPKPKSSTTEEEDLKWVEDNIPAYLSDSALPILDSDEEATNTRFEVSKMQ